MDKYLRILSFFCLYLITPSGSFAQLCGPTVPSFTVDLTGFPSGSWISPVVVRQDTCCGATSPDRCVEFWVTLDPAAQGISFSIASGAIPPGALYYEISCMNPTAVGDTMCLNGVGPHHITFCKPGNNNNTYEITSIAAPGAGPPTVVSQGCTGMIYATGYNESSISWTSVFPGPVGSYDLYLSCDTACDTVIVTAQPGYPPYALYEICGYPIGGCGIMLICDTVRVDFVSDLATTIQPQNPVICFGGPPTTITANGFGGGAPYSYLWSTGATTSSIVVGVGTYWVQMNDTTNCSPVFDTVTVTNYTVNITASAGLDDTVCIYNPVFNLNGSVTGVTTGMWTNGNGTYNPSDTILNSTYTPSAGEISSGTVTLILITTNTAGCPPDSDTIVLTIAPPPAAAFSNNIVCFGNTTIFTDNSTVPFGNITGWSWNFGDTTFSTLQNPSHTYTAAGTYTVTLIAGTSYGCVDTIQQTVLVNPAPVAAFTNSAQCFVDSVFFTDNSTIVNGTITGWNWNFGDATTSTLQNPSHWYSSPGTYTVTLIVTSNSGCSDTISQIVNVQPSPLANFSATQVCFGSTTFFNDSSTISSGTITGWNWNFGDPLSVPNNTSSLQNPSHIFTSAGTFTVTLIITSNSGCTDTIAIPVTVNALPVANFSTTTVCQGNATSFTDLSTGNPVSWSWSFPGGNPALSSSQNPSSVFPAGTYTVTLIAGTSFGCTDTISQVITVNPTPVAAFSNTAQCFVDSVYFTDGSSISSGNISGWSWNFGDPASSPNNTSSLQNPWHSFSASGTFTVTLIVTSNFGCSDTISQVLTVSPKPITSFSVTTVCRGDSATFTDLSTGTPVSWNWNFGDATSSTLQNPSHSYSLTGTYTVTLIVGTAFGCSDTISLTINVYPAPIAVFSNSAQCFIDSVYFTDNSSISSGNISSWNWNFGDPASGLNNTSSLQNPPHYYGASGNYTVTLVVTSNFGCTDTITQTIFVAPGPLANFGAIDVCLGSQNIFTDSSSIPFGNIVSWNWAFGDATNSTLQNPSHLYSSPGTYNVTLIVISDLGCTDTIIKQVIVHPIPVAQIMALGACLIDGTTISDASTILTPDSIVQWFWDFGDGTNSTQQNTVHYFPSPGNYGVTLIVTSNFGCSDTISQVVSVNPSPTAAFSYDPVVTLLYDDINFTDLSQGGVSWFWDFGDSSISNVQNPNHIYYAVGTYQVMEVVTNQYGCTDTIWHEVIILLPPNIPTGFSPNGDGHNDIFYVLGGPYIKLEFRIYNNWGELIFVSYSQKDGWNGTYKGIKQPMGVYVYTVHATTEDKKEHFLKGDVTLLR